MSENKNNKKEILKDIIKQLHKGLSAQDAKKRFEKEIGTVNSSEIVELEQELVNEGLSPDEIKKFCNVHALLFESSLTATPMGEVSQTHPIYLFKQENKHIQNLTSVLKDLAKTAKISKIPESAKKIAKHLAEIKGIELHYTRKEQILFPYLERYGFFGPSKVMWGKDNEIRDLLKKALAKISSVSNEIQMKQFTEDNLNPLIEEVDGMVFKEENILFPAALEKLSAADWAEILKQSEEVGYVFINKPAITKALIEEMQNSVIEEPRMGEGVISFPTGRLDLEELTQMLNVLPVDISFVDKNENVKYFSDNKNRIFLRTKSIIGRNVKNCHPPQSVDRVMQIIDAFREGKKDTVDFWITMQGKLIYIRYFAVRSIKGEYLGTLEVTQDLTHIKELQGQKRLLDEKN